MNVLKTLRTTVAVTVLAALPVMTSAQGVPTIDATAITQDAANSAKEVAEMVRQYEQLLQQYEKLEQQRVMLENSFKAISGLTDLDEFNSRSFLKLATAADTLGYALNATEDTIGDLPGVAGLAMERRSISLGLNNGILSEFSGSDVPARRILSERGAAGLMASALGEQGYDMAGQLAEDAEKLRGEVGQQEDLKAAIDYNTAVLLKLLQVEIEILRATSANALASGTDLAANAADLKTLSNYARGESQ
ncbi:type IV secretion system protein [uncultured Ruegeria sp.]|uniref:type IV secretion system protein n=1 Tax=uncultured Ruegeria sp. TaxID=259304 RepID=UPI00262B2171|nr:type IV secretion system protein [uncultured Ruegeria sp.]